MPEVRWRHDRAKLIIDAVVLPPQGAANQMSMERVSALIDTGANRSGITPGLATRLGLVSTGKKPVQTATGLTQADRFSFRVGFYPTSIDGSSGLQPYVLADELYGTGLGPLIGFELIVGMDVLGKSELHLRSDGETVFRF